MLYVSTSFFFFFFNDTATTEIYTLSLHDALPICDRDRRERVREGPAGRHDDKRGRDDADRGEGVAEDVQVRAPDVEARGRVRVQEPGAPEVRGEPHHRDGEHRDRKSTRLNSSH